jgi:hypothetical protein
MAMTPEQARAAVAQLELQTGGPLAATPVSLQDQWGATFRDDMASLGADITDPAVARAAFAGAFVMAQAVLPMSLVPPQMARMAAVILRHLADRGDRPPADRIEDWWRES